MIIDIPNSGVALAVSAVAAAKNKLFIVSGAAASDLTGPSNANTIHWAYDTWMLANGTGKAMVNWRRFGSSSPRTTPSVMRSRRDTGDVVEKNGGKILGRSAIR